MGTLPGYRLQGFNRGLHEIALAEALPARRFAFLYADDEAVPFYRKCGFRPVAVHAVRVPLPEADGDPVMEKLDMDAAAVRDRLYRLACARAGVARLLHEEPE